MIVENVYMYESMVQVLVPFILFSFQLQFNTINYLSIYLS